MLSVVTSRLGAFAFVHSTYVSLMKGMCIMEESLRVGLKIKLPLVRHVGPSASRPACLSCRFPLLKHFSRNRVLDVETA